jgi:hypothetical protein
MPNQRIPKGTKRKAKRKRQPIVAARLSRRQKRAVRERAGQEQRPVSWIIEKALEAYLRTPINDPLIAESGTAA